MSAADIIIRNGRVLTMDPAAPEAEAVAVSGNRIAAVGREADIMALAGPSTQIVDAKGGSVLPGFIEAHMHLFAGAAELRNLHLSGVSGFEALRDAIQPFAASRKDWPLLVVQNADYTVLGAGERVTRHHLDRIVADQPLMLVSPDHHTAWANTIALERAGILKGRVLGAGNEIVMGADGLAEGELREGEAFGPVTELAGEDRARLGLSTGGEPERWPNAAEWEADLATMKAGLDYCARHGITSIHNMDGNFYQLQLLEELGKRGQLSCRVEVPFHFKNFMQLGDLAKAVEMRQRWASPMLHSGCVKVFYDGVLDSWTAVMVDNYADRPGWRGEPLFSPEDFAVLATEADRLGLRIAVHAIGDGAVRAVLDGYEAAAKANGARDSRHRIEHIEVIHPDDIARFAKLGVIASMQPPHPPGTMGLPLEPTLSRIGKARWKYAYAWQTLRQAGARLVFATDWPVSPIDPIASIHAAVTRPKWSGDLPDQRQSLSDALAAYTRDGAYAEFMEAQKGMLKPGMLADVAVLDGDIAAIDPAAISGLKVATTICDGRVSFTAV